MKQANNVEQQSTAEHAERRASTKRNASTDPEASTLSLAQSEEGLARIRLAARADKNKRFNNLLHHINPTLLRRAYGHIKRKAAPGVDGETWASYGENLEANLQSLNNRVHSKRYKANAVKRVWIEKADGSQRPLGITAVEDKILQQALVWVLESIYETDFKGFSYGFRPHKSTHNALDAVYVAITQRRIGNPTT